MVDKEEPGHKKHHHLRPLHRLLAISAGEDLRTGGVTTHIHAVKDYALVPPKPSSTPAPTIDKTQKSDNPDRQR